MFKKEKCGIGYSSCCVCVFVLKTDHSRLDCVLIQSAHNQVDQLSGIHKVKKIWFLFASILTSGNHSLENLFYNYTILFLMKYQYS